MSEAAGVHALNTCTRAGADAVRTGGAQKVDIDRQSRVISALGLKAVERIVKARAFSIGCTGSAAEAIKNLALSDLSEIMVFDPTPLAWEDLSSNAFLDFKAAEAHLSSHTGACNSADCRGETAACSAYGEEAATTEVDASRIVMNRSEASIKALKALNPSTRITLVTKSDLLLYLECVGDAPREQHDEKTSMLALAEGIKRFVRNEPRNSTSEGLLRSEADANVVVVLSNPEQILPICFRSDSIVSTERLVVELVEALRAISLPCILSSTYGLQMCIVSDFGRCTEEGNTISTPGVASSSRPNERDFQRPVLIEDLSGERGEKGLAIRSSCAVGVRSSPLAAPARSNSSLPFDSRRSNTARAVDVLCVEIDVSPPDASSVGSFSDAFYFVWEMEKKGETQRQKVKALIPITSSKPHFPKTPDEKLFVRITLEVELRRTEASGYPTLSPHQQRERRGAEGAAQGGVVFLAAPDAGDSSCSASSERAALQSQLITELKMAFEEEGATKPTGESDQLISEGNRGNQRKSVYVSTAVRPVVAQHVPITACLLQSVTDSALVMAKVDLAIPNFGCKPEVSDIPVHTQTGASSCTKVFRLSFSETVEHHFSVFMKELAGTGTHQNTADERAAIRLKARIKRVQEEMSIMGSSPRVLAAAVGFAAIRRLGRVPCRHCNRDVLRYLNVCESIVEEALLGALGGNTCRGSERLGIEDSPDNTTVKRPPLNDDDSIADTKATATISIAKQYIPHLLWFLLTAQGSIAAYSSIAGGYISQEVMKYCSRQYRPLNGGGQVTTSVSAEESQQTPLWQTPLHVGHKGEHDGEPSTKHALVPRSAEHHHEEKDRAEKENSVDNVFFDDDDERYSSIEIEIGGGVFFDHGGSVGVVAGIPVSNAEHHSNEAAVGPSLKELNSLYDVINKLWPSKNMSAGAIGGSLSNPQQVQEKYSRHTCLRDVFIGRRFLRTRYQGAAELLGGKRLELLQNTATVFVVGAGAVGCEYLKNLAMLGVGVGPRGAIIVTDNDKIERSNLTRQFLFRDHHVGMFKSQTAATVIKSSINAKVKIRALTEKVYEGTCLPFPVARGMPQSPFDSRFWQKVSIVAIAVDNNKARQFLLEHCRRLGKPIINAGTLGSQGSVDTIVPFITNIPKISSEEDGGDSGGGGGGGKIPQCTLHFFPSNINHCIQYAVDAFAATFRNPILTAQQFVKRAAAFHTQRLNSKICGTGTSESQNTSTSSLSLPSGETQTHHPDLTFQSLLDSWDAQHMVGIAVTTLHSILVDPKTRITSLADCVREAARLWHQWHVVNIRRLLAQHPIGSVDEKTGRKFWSSTKTPPSPLKWLVLKKSPRESEMREEEEEEGDSLKPPRQSSSALAAQLISHRRLQEDFIVSASLLFATSFGLLNKKGQALCERKGHGDAAAPSFNHTNSSIADAENDHTRSNNDRSGERTSGGVAAQRSYILSIADECYTSVAADSEASESKQRKKDEEEKDANDNDKSEEEHSKSNKVAAEEAASKARLAAKIADLSFFFYHEPHRILELSSSSHYSVSEAFSNDSSDSCNIVNKREGLCPQVLEKDDDNNHHIAFITACSNSRAACYGIPSETFFETKRIAGNILPALVSTTAVVSGIGTLMVVQGAISTTAAAAMAGSTCKEGVLLLSSLGCSSLPTVSVAPRCWLEQAWQGRRRGEREGEREGNENGFTCPFFIDLADLNAEDDDDGGEPRFLPRGGNGLKPPSRAVLRTLFSVYTLGGLPLPPSLPLSQKSAPTLQPSNRPSHELLRRVRSRLLCELFVGGGVSVAYAHNSSLYASDTERLAPLLYLTTTMTTTKKGNTPATALLAPQKGPAGVSSADEALVVGSCDTGSSNAKSAPERTQKRLPLVFTSPWDIAVLKMKTDVDTFTLANVLVPEWVKRKAHAELSEMMTAESEWLSPTQQEMFEDLIKQAVRVSSVIDLGTGGLTNLPPALGTVVVGTSTPLGQNDAGGRACDASGEVADEKERLNVLLQSGMGERTRLGLKERFGGRDSDEEKRAPGNSPHQERRINQSSAANNDTKEKRCDMHDACNGNSGEADDDDKRCDFYYHIHVDAVNPPEVFPRAKGFEESAVSLELKGTLPTFRLFVV